MKVWRGVAGAAAGATAASVAASIAVERYAMSRLRGRLDTGALRRFHEPRGRQLTVTADDGVPLHVEMEGGGSADGADGGAERTDLTLVFCHGWTLEQASWYYQREQLGDLGRLVFWDQRCHGRSGRAHRDSISMEALGGDLRAVLEAAAPRGPLVLVGHSLGGMTVMALAAAYPELFTERVVGVALINTSASGLAASLSGVLGVALRTLAPVCLDAMGRVAGPVQRIRGMSKVLSHVATQRLAFGAGDADPETVAFMDGMVRATPVDVVADYYPAILAHDKLDSLEAFRDVPALVLSGADDRLVPPSSSRVIAAALPGAEHVEVPMAGHMVMLERPGMVNDALRALVRRARRFTEVGQRA